MEGVGIEVVLTIICYRDSNSGTGIGTPDTALFKYTHTYSASNVCKAFLFIQFELDDYELHTPLPCTSLESNEGTLMS